MQFFGLNLDAGGSPETSVPSYHSKVDHIAQQCYVFTQFLLPRPLAPTHAAPEWNTRTE